MSEYGRCTKCGSHRWKPQDCNCQLFECAIEDIFEPSWTEVYATDEEDAAERFADRYDCESADYIIVKQGDGGDTIVLVRHVLAPETLVRCHVYGETNAQYHASKISKMDSP